MKSEELRPRPNIPPILSFALAFWAGAALLWETAYALSLFMVLVIAILLLVAALLVRQIMRGRTLPLLLVIAFALGCAVSVATSQSVVFQREAISSIAQAGEMEFFVLEDERDTDFGSSCLTLARPKGSNPIKVRAYLDSEQELRFGERFSCAVQLEPPSESSEESFNRKGIVARCSVANMERVESPDVISWIAGIRNESIARLTDTVSAGSLEDDASIFLKAVLFADRSDLYESALYQDVKVCGLAHLVAVSGAHLVIICGFVSIMLDRLRVGQKMSLAIQLLFLGGYLVMVGLPPSCMRAAVMAVCAHLSAFTLRRPSSLNALGLALIIFIALDPSLSVSLSLQLSALATLGILVLMPLFSNWVDGFAFNVPEVISQPLVMTFAATLTTFPVSCAIFAQLPIVAPIANVVATPLLSLVCIIGVLGFILQPLVQLSNLVFTLALCISQLFCKTCSCMAGIPFSCFPVSAEGKPLGFVSFAALSLLWWLWPRPSIKVIPGLVTVPLAFLLVLCPPIPDDGTYLRMLDVGQGDAILLQSEGNNVLVDTGNEPAKLLAGLSRAGVKHLDAIVITHADDDHCGSLADIRNIIGVDEVVLAQGVDDVGSEKCIDLIEESCNVSHGQSPTYAARGAQICFGCWRCIVLWPGELRDEAGNADSICLLAACDVDEDGNVDYRALLCGDAESEVLDEIIASGDLGDIDIYKVGHHGSKGAISSDQASILKPEIALVSVGANNRYGHPAKQVLSTLAEVGADVYRTDQSGDVVCSFTQSEICVSTMR